MFELDEWSAAAAPWLLLAFTLAVAMYFARR
jgi:hypothetical protein